MSHITAIVPAYNEELSIGSVILCTSEFADHIIVIDDGSTDRTAEIAEKAGAQVIKHPENMGKGAALKTGFSAINNSDIIVTIDGDGQHNPMEIPKLTKPIEKGEADIVNGSRYLQNMQNGTPAYRRLGQTVLDTATNMNTGGVIPCRRTRLERLKPYGHFADGLAPARRGATYKKVGQLCARGEVARLLRSHFSGRKTYLPGERVLRAGLFLPDQP